MATIEYDTKGRPVEIVLEESDYPQGLGQNLFDPSDWSDWERALGPIVEEFGGAPLSQVTGDAYLDGREDASRPGFNYEQCEREILEYTNREIDSEP